MTARNAYATLSEFIAYVPQGTTNSITTALAELALEAASLQIDREVGSRHFYPRVINALYDVPSGRELTLRDDLLEIISITNGDGVAVASTEYKLLLGDIWPKRWIRINAMSTDYWTSSTTNGNEDAIAVNAIWGYHTDYPIAWSTGSTLAAAVTSLTSTSLTVTSGTNFSAGQIIRIDNELKLITAVNTVTLTVERANNGSTAATHLNGAAVSIWRPDKGAANACLVQAHRIYKRNSIPFGTQGGGEFGIQIAEVPLDPDVKAFCDKLKWRL
jgi:hypothetical protein